MPTQDPPVLDSTFEDKLDELISAVTPNVPGFVSDAYDPTDTYAVGDYAIHENILYRCTTAISTPEAWNSAHWTPTNCANELSQLKSSLSNLTLLADETYHFTQAQTYEYTGISFTIPANKIAMAAVQTLYAQTKPLGTIISDSNTTLGNHVVFEYKNDATYPTNVTPFYLLSSGTYYIWCKRNSVVTSGNDPIKVYGKIYDV